jgi:hypothetical protein
LQAARKKPGFENLKKKKRRKQNATKQEATVGKVRRALHDTPVARFFAEKLWARSAC